MNATGDAAVIVLAGGSGTRFGAGTNKVYLSVAGATMISWSVRTLAGLPEVGPVVLVVRPEDREAARAVLAGEADGLGVELVDGGGTRQESELCGLRHLAARIGDGSVDTVLIHDGARPLVTGELARTVLHAARATGGAVPGLPRGDLALLGGQRERLAGPAPGGLVAVQTPQGFRAVPLLAAYEQAARQGFTGTDTASCMERFGDVAIRWITGEERNIKVTYPRDLLVAEAELARRNHRSDE